MFDNIHVIILTAGKGERLRPLTNDIPKSLLTLFGRTLLDHNIKALSSLNLKNITLVTGHGHGALPQHLECAHNPLYNTTNMAFSLLETGCIKEHQNILVLYGDCIYEASVIRSLLQKGLQYPHGPTLAIDKEWLNLWKKRFDNPLSDCETLSLKDDMIIEIGQKPTTLDGIEGQYTGLFFIPQSCIPLFQETYKTLKITQEDSRKEKLFLTDVFQAWIHEKKPLFFHAIHGGWLECDQHSDLILYESLYKQNKLEEIYHINDLFR